MRRTGVLLGTTLLALGAGVARVGAQQQRQGRVSNAASGAPVAGAVVRWAHDPAPAVETDESGRFRLAARAGRRTVAIAAIGFVPDTLDVAAAGFIDIRLSPAAIPLDSVVVAGVAGQPPLVERVHQTAGLMLRPRHSAQELLEVVPGLAIAQHGGGGKAEQIFLRGFDADHGTDVAVFVDDVPINLVSHAHGQGYADLHFLIPDVVADIDVRKGGHAASDGNLATAGAIRLRTRDRLDAASARVRVGGFGTRDLLGMLPLGSQRGAGGYVAVQRFGSDGPFDVRQGHRRHNVFSRFTVPLTKGSLLRLSASGYDARWNASGQIPERAVLAGRIGRFGAIDPTEGGHTSRFDVWASLESQPGRSLDWRIGTYAVRYRLDLFSNFTFFLNDPGRGDGIEQVDDRWIAGVSGSVGGSGSPFGTPGSWRMGASVRHDGVDLLLAAQSARARLAPVSAAGIAETNAAVWVTQRLQLNPRIGLAVGVRADVFRFAVADQLGALSAVSRWAGRLSPKLGVTIDAGHGTDVVAQASGGFHSSDARRAVARESAVSPLPAARTVEVGARHDGRRVRASASLWRTWTESELVYVGDEGTTEPIGRALRMGVDLSLETALRPWLALDSDLSLARGRLVDEPAGADNVPLAPSRTASVGLTVRDAGPWSAGLRIRHIGTRPADERGEILARGHLLTRVAVSYRRGRLEFSAAIDNLFDVAWNEAQFATTSRLRDERAPVTELHFTPGAPREVELGIRLTW